MEAGKELGWLGERVRREGECPCLAGQACFLRSQGMRELGPHYTLWGPAGGWRVEQLASRTALANIPCPLS